MVKDMAEVIDVIKILKGLKYNLMFVKCMNTTPLNVIIILTIKVMRQILLKKKRMKIQVLLITYNNLKGD